MTKDQDCLIRRLADFAGYCCLHEMLRSNDMLSNKGFGQMLGISIGSVRYWRKKLKANLIARCERCPPPQAPRTPIVYSAGAGYKRFVGPDPKIPLNESDQNRGRSDSRNRSR